jgi:ketosteroid isomerase-like protein
MASANVAAVQSVIDLYGRLDPDPARRRGSAELEELLAHFADDVEFVQSASLPGAGSFRGRGQLERSWADWLGAWAGFRTEIEEVQERGDRVLVLSHDRFVGRDGVEVENHGGSIYTLRDGLIVRFEAFIDQDSARREFEAG